MDVQMMMSQSSRNRFDDLPEEVVVLIFSFLPTRCAVKASLSCKAWKYLWMSLPNLRFKEFETETGSSVPNLSKEERRLFDVGWVSTPNLSIEQLRSKQSKRELFLEFVSRVIRFRKPLKINEFSIGLDCNGSTNADLIRRWIEYAVDHGVEVFHLRLFCDTGIRSLHPLPAALFNCKSLTEMHIEMDGILMLPYTLFHFPSLKILRLVGVWFCNTPLIVSQLFSDCPLLEELHLLECSMGYHTKIQISAPRLTSLSITELDDTEFFPQRCQFIIHGTNLKRIIYQGQFMDDYLFVNSPSPQEACIRIQLLNDVDHKKVAGQACGLLEELYNVSFLSISHGTLQFFDKEKDTIFAKLPVFHNLTHLQLTHGRTNISSNGLLSLLVKSPSLHHLEFTEGSQIVHANITKVMELWPTLQCLLTSLQYITVAKFYGESEEYNGLKVLLMISRVLEKLHLNFMEREILRRLTEMFPKERLQLISIS